MKTKEKEIFSSCCAFGGAFTEEVHVLSSDCPIKREQGARLAESRGIRREECTCIYISSFGGGVPKCEFYEGYKKVTRNKEQKYKVLCSAIKMEGE